MSLSVSERRRLGTSDLWIAPAGLGSWAIGGDSWASGLGFQDDHESMYAIRRAIELGINWIDTAAAYGAGHAEAVVGRALRATPTRIVR
jgi:aryl-alcohol dehydrogenase-like predicted oxidoreductase